MSIFKLSNRGFTLIEVIVAVVLITIGIIAALSMQPMSWQTTGKSDLLGRGAGVLQNELETREMLIMNPNNAVATGTFASTVYPSGEAAAQTGDIPYTLSTNISDNGNSSWTVVVTVSWPAPWGGNSSISESKVVTRQEGFRY